MRDTVGLGSEVRSEISLLPRIGSLAVKQRRTSRPRASVVANWRSDSSASAASGPGGSTALRSSIALIVCSILSVESSDDYPASSCTQELL